MSLRERLQGFVTSSEPALPMGRHAAHRAVGRLVGTQPTSRELDPFLISLA